MKCLFHGLLVYDVGVPNSFFAIPKGQKRVTVVDAGVFPCPRCRTDRTYDATGIHETTGLLGRFVPGVHGKLLEVLLTCHGCNDQFPSYVRDRPLFADRTPDPTITQNVGGTLTQNGDGSAGSIAE